MALGSSTACPRPSGVEVSLLRSRHRARLSRKSLRESNRLGSEDCSRFHDQVAFALMARAIDRIIYSEPGDLIDFRVMRGRIAADALHQVKMHALENLDRRISGTVAPRINV